MDILSNLNNAGSAVKNHFVAPLNWLRVVDIRRVRFQNDDHDHDGVVKMTCSEVTLSCLLIDDELI